jgi:hypothetical protein
MSKTPSINHRFLEDTETKQSAIYALQDVKKRNAAGRGNFTVDELNKADELLALARAAFIRSRCFLNTREKFITLKIENVKSSDKLSTAYDVFEQAIAQLNPDNDHKNGHYLFHIFPRK